MTLPALLFIISNTLLVLLASPHLLVEYACSLIAQLLSALCFRRNPEASVLIIPLIQYFTLGALCVSLRDPRALFIALLAGLSITAELHYGLKRSPQIREQA